MSMTERERSLFNKLPGLVKGAVKSLREAEEQLRDLSIIYSTLSKNLKTTDNETTNETHK